MTQTATCYERYVTQQSLQSWSYVCGLCAARETAFLAPRFIDELGALSTDEVASRLARTFIGSVEPLASFDKIAINRLEQELGDILDVSPSPVAVDLVRLGYASNRMRSGLNALPARMDAATFAQELEQLSIRAADFAEMFAQEFAGVTGDPGDDARTAAAMVVDSSELAIIQTIASAAEDPIIQKWAEYRVGEGAARVAQRALKLQIPRDVLSAYFFRGILMSSRAQDFMSDYNEAAALAMYPSGMTPDNVQSKMLDVTGESVGNPFSPGRVLHYLQLFMDQIRRLRLAVYEATGRIRKEAA